MKKWFSVPVKLDVEDESGVVKAEVRKYLIEAETFTEAESTVYKEMESNGCTEFVINDIKRFNVSELFIDGYGSKYYIIRVVLTVFNDETDRELKKVNRFLALADSLNEALDTVTNSLDKTNKGEYEVLSVVLDNIYDAVFQQKVEN